MLSSLVPLALLYLAALIIPGPNLLLLTHTAASSSRTESCIQMTFGNGTSASASCVTPSASRLLRNISTMSTGRPISASEP